MKLVELLARELSEWPKGVVRMCQSVVDSEFYGEDDPGNCIFRAYPENSSGNPLSEDAYEYVTRAQWQAERDRQKGGEWIRNRGNSKKAPVDIGTMVEVRFRNGFIEQDNGYPRWHHDGTEFDIMAYRVISQPQAEEVEVKDTTIGTLSYKVEIDTSAATRAIDDLAAKWDQIDGPIKWRDQIVELEAHEEDIQREIASLHARLTEEGFSLVRQYPSVKQPEPTLDMSDWRNWKVGDIISVTNDCDVADGEYSIIEVEHKAYEGDMPVKTDGGWPDMDCASIKFIRRP